MFTTQTRAGEEKQQQNKKRTLDIWIVCQVKFWQFGKLVGFWCFNKWDKILFLLALV